MDSHTYISFTLSLIQSSGLFGRVGSPNLFCWASAAHLPSGPLDNGRIVVLSRDSSTGDWREYAGALSIEQSLKIIELLNALGLPDRTPDVEGVVDTSDSWSHISFETRIERQHTNLEIMMHSSGFEGNDAARLNKLFLYLFNLAGYEGYGWSFYSDTGMGK
jgi:hypothetical protein